MAKLVSALALTSAAHVLSAPQPPADVRLLFSEYAEGSSNNKYVEIFNAGSATGNLGDFALARTANGASGTHEYWNTFTPGAVVQPGAVFVVANPSAEAGILAYADMTSSGIAFNGDDCVALVYGSESDYTVIDTIGDFGADPGDGWDVCGTAGATKDQTLVRKSSVTQGNADWTASVGASSADCEWMVYPQNTWTYLGSHTADTVLSDNSSSSDNGTAPTPTPTPMPMPTPTPSPSSMMFSNCSCNAYTPIGSVQGSGSESPMAGSEVTVKGVVTAVLDGLNGYFIQEVDGGDGDSATSDGIFVYSPGSSEVAQGDLVVVTGIVSEFYGQTQISGPEVVLCASHQALPFPVLLTELPMRKDVDTVFEPLEGMLIMLAKPVTVTDFYNLGRYGEMTLSSEGRNIVPSQLVDPLSAEHAQMYDELRDTLMVDDGSTQQNPDPEPFLRDGTSYLRVGDMLSNVVGPLAYSFSLWRLHLAPGMPEPAIFHSNPRPSMLPDVGGSIKVAGFNVLNYFNGGDPGWAFSDSENRGADSQSEFDRQRAKTINAISAVEASVVGLLEVENDGFGPNSAVQDIVNGLNGATSPGKYALVDPGVDMIGTDVIACKIIYQPHHVTVLGQPAILNSSVDPEFIDTKNRPALAVTFESQLTGDKFTVAVNHLKSKGSSCVDCCDDPEVVGVGNCNGVRTKAADALARWLETSPTGVDTDNTLIIGDLNAYHSETPIQTLIVNHGYVDMIDAFHTKEKSWSYVFRGLSGYLDHALASAALVPNITGVVEWHINADENTLLDYNENWKSAGQISSLYDDSPFRSSDHDPVVIGLFPMEAATCGMVREWYRQEECCGAPSKVLVKPGWC